MTATTANLTASVRKRLGASFALDVTVSLSPGITMLFGASGSGKTTLLRCLAGLSRPDAGSISIGSQVLFSSAPPLDVPVRSRNIGYVFQQLALFPHMTVADNIGYGLAGRDDKARRERVRAIAESFRIWHVLSSSPRRISGGERQRTALARSLVLEPSLLLLDEPLSALDHATQSRIIEDLRTWNDAHRIPILYVTHAHREVFALGERVLAMDKGRIIADGTPAEVIDAPAHEPLAQIAGFENVFDGSVVARRADAGTMRYQIDAPGAPGNAVLEVPLVNTRPGSPVRMAIRAGDILLANQEPRGLSARNILDGSLTSLRREGPTVVAEVQAGARFVVHLTPSAVEGLGLAPGMRVWLIIKTHSCRIVAAG
jgi:molybdate transport system ATP-binding protein